MVDAVVRDLLLVPYGGCDVGDAVRLGFLDWARSYESSLSFAFGHMQFCSDIGDLFWIGKICGPGAA
jgi:hypothetical protein